MDINHLTLEELKIVKDSITQRINELSGKTSQQKSLEKSKLALRKYILENKEEVIKDLQEMRDKSSKNKQETLEEFIKDVLQDEFFTNIAEYKKAERLIQIGAKWQAERMYSEEEVLEILEHHTKYLETFIYQYIDKNDMEENKIWFEQFKKK
jgi:hypothetical protein